MNWWSFALGAASATLGWMALILWGLYRLGAAPPAEDFPSHSQADVNRWTRRS